MIPQLELYDACLLIIYLFLIYVGVILHVQKKKKENAVYRFYLPALTLKITGGLVYALYHVYIYKGGDTFGFFDAARSLLEYIDLLNPSTFEIYFSDYDSDKYGLDTWYDYVLGSKDVFFIVKLTSLVSVIGLGSYYTTTILFSFLSFIGLWKLFLSLTRLYSKHDKVIFYAIFTMPTMLLWSSGILKDSVAIGAMGFIVYVIANIFIFNESKTKSIFILGICLIIIFNLKPYLVYLLIPAILIWIQSNIKAKINSTFIKNLVMPIILISIVISGFLTINFLSSSAGKYSIGNWQSTLQGFHSWHGHLAETRDQSGYSLGEMEYTVLGVLAKAPAALNVTFFRPYPWEVRNIATLLGALEGVFLFIVTIFVFYRARGKLLKLVIGNKDILFLLSFALPFAFIVGLSSYNFGALSRYKIPAELFYLIALALIYKLSSVKKV